MFVAVSNIADAGIDVEKRHFTLRSAPFWQECRVWWCLVDGSRSIWYQCPRDTHAADSRDAESGRQEHCMTACHIIMLFSFTGTYWFIIRGVEALPVLLSEIDLPAAARLYVSKIV